MTIETALISAVTAMGAAIGWLAIWAKSQVASLWSKWQECEDDRKKIHARLAEIVLQEREDHPNHPKKATTRVQIRR